MATRNKPEDFIDASDVIAHANAKLHSFLTLLKHASPEPKLELSDNAITGACLILEEIVDDIDGVKELLDKCCRREAQ